MQAVLMHQLTHCASLIIAMLDQQSPTLVQMLVRVGDDDAQGLQAVAMIGQGIDWFEAQIAFVQMPVT